MSELERKRFKIQTARYIHEVLVPLAQWADRNCLAELAHRLRLAACEAAERAEDGA